MQNCWSCISRFATTVHCGGDFQLKILLIFHSVIAIPLLEVGKYFRQLRRRIKGHGRMKKYIFLWHLSLMDQLR